MILKIRLTCRKYQLYMNPAKPASIDEYIDTFPEETQRILQQVRAAIKTVVPEAEETIGYAIPTFKLNKINLVHFAGFKNHIGFYPTPVAGEVFKEELANYKTGKGSVQFPLDKPMPLDLITRIVEYRIKETSESSKMKQTS